MSNPLFIAVNLDKVVLKQCVRCGSMKSPIDEHHVTYKPKVTKVYLCRPCHVGITVINGTYAQRWGVNLENGIRRKLFKRFMECSWRMSNEEKPITKLVRRRAMTYKNRLRVLQVMFFKEGK